MIARPATGFAGFFYQVARELDEQGSNTHSLHNC